MNYLDPDNQYPIRPASPLEWLEVINGLARRIEALEDSKASAPARGSMNEARTAIFVVATKVRDAVNRYRDSRLQKDADELDRLTRLFNMPPERFIEAMIAEIANG